MSIFTSTLESDNYIHDNHNHDHDLKVYVIVKQINAFSYIPVRV